MRNLADHLGLAPAPTTRRRARVARTLAALLAVLVLVAAVVHVAGDALLTQFLGPKLEQAFSTHQPGSSLRLGAVRYDVWRNRVEFDSVALTPAGGAAASARSVSATGVKWGRLMLGERRPERLFGQTAVEIADLSAVVLNAEYRVRCGQLRVSVPDGEIVAQALTLQSVASDEAFFAATPFRRARYHFAAASCALQGVGFAELLTGQGYRVRSVELAGPVFESLVNGEKPRPPVTQSPVMPHEALAAITKPFRIDQLTFTDATVKHSVRRFEGADPGVLTFSRVQLRATEIANAAAGGQTIAVHAEGWLMNDGAMTVQMRLPVAPSALAFQYSGKLSAMDLTRLDQYMGGVGRFQIKSGTASEAFFDINVVDGRAHGSVHGVYRDLQVKVVDRETGSPDGVTDRVATMLANQLKVRPENSPDATGAEKTGKVDYARKPEESFLQFSWAALRTGLVDLISAQLLPIPER